LHSRKVAPPTCLMSRDERRSTATKWIEDYSIAFRDILDRIGNHSDRTARGGGPRRRHRAESSRELRANLTDEIGARLSSL
jgi:hypothetical protein